MRFVVCLKSHQIGTDKRACIEWPSQLPGGWLLGNYSSHFAAFPQTIGSHLAMKPAFGNLHHSIISSRVTVIPPRKAARVLLVLCEGTDI